MTVAFSFHFCTISGSHLHLELTIFFISWTDLTSHCVFFLPWHLVSTCSLCTWLHERVLWPFKDIANVFYFYFFNLSQRKRAELNYKNKCFSLLDICFCRGQLICLRPIKKNCCVYLWGWGPCPPHRKVHSSELFPAVLCQNCTHHPSESPEEDGGRIWAAQEPSRASLDKNRTTQTFSRKLMFFFSTMWLDNHCCINLLA